MEPSAAFRDVSSGKTEFFAKLKPCCVDIVREIRKRGQQPGESAIHGGEAPAPPSSAGALLVSLTDRLYGILTDQISYDASVLDPAVADYAFFPLLQIFQHMSDYPTRLVENAIKCLRVLIQYGWKMRLPKDKAQQFLMLLTAISTGASLTGGRKISNSSTTEARIPEETKIEAFRALAVLIKTSGSSGSPSSALVAAHVIPALAHTVTVLLEGVTNSVVADVQMAALDAIESLYDNLGDLEAQASFLPGTVSALVRVFTSPGATKAPRRVLIRTLSVLDTVLVATLGDMYTWKILKRPTESEQTSTEGQLVASSSTSTADDPVAAEEVPVSPVKKAKLTKAWVKETEAQVKVALASVLKLRNHESEEVRNAVQKLCLALLDECNTSLADCAPILVESAIITAKRKYDGEDQQGQDFKVGLGAMASRAITTTTSGRIRFQQDLQQMAIVHPELVDIITSTAYDWAVSLPRAMQSSDEDAKQRAIRNLQNAVVILESLHVDSATFKSALTAALRDSVVTLVLSSASTTKAGVDEIDVEVSLEGEGGDMVLLSHPESKAMVQSRQYKPVILTQSSQAATRDAVLRLVSDVGTALQQSKLAAELLDFVRDSSGLEQVASFWLAFELTKSAFAKSQEVDEFFDTSELDDGGGGPENVFSELFSISVSTLAANTDTTYDRDWRMGAIALEVTAYSAYRLREAFRPELIDVLYPVATYLGSPEPRLRSHAITTLNSLAASCGYADVSELMVANVDYMLNSVSLRLNTFDISPASTKVLSMMIRLAGPRLVPFLDDVVAAIFAALDNYHGYPLFVESLFAVLGEIVQQSVRPDAPLLLQQDTSASGVFASGSCKHRKRPREADTTATLLGILDRRAKRRQLDLEEEAEEAEAKERRKGSGLQHPQKPWKSEADKLLGRRGKGEDGGEDGGSDSDGDGVDDKAAASSGGNEAGNLSDPKTPTYALLARITTLTQHYLTSPTPTLRKSLLDLLATVAPALAQDENAFLPLVNEIWPVVITRLQDGEPYVVLAACHTLSALCASAGDFLATRFQAEWHASLGKWCRSNSTQAVAATTSAAASIKRPSVIHIHQRPFRGRGSAGVTVGATASPISLPTRLATEAGDEKDAVPQLVELSLSLSASPSSAAAQRTVDTNMYISASPSSASSSGLGRFAQSAKIWEATAEMLTAIVAYVKLEDDIYDEILDLLLLSRASRRLPVAARQQALEALEAVNADAVWLALYQSNQMADTNKSLPQRPELAGVAFVSLEERDTR